VSGVRPTVRAAVLAAVVVGVDQATKALVRGSIERGDSDSILPGISLVNTRNTGVAFGLFDQGGALVTVVTVAALAALLVFFVLNRGRRLAWLPTGLLIGGAAGNMIDRASGEGVTDFVKLPAWPAFNVADMCITVGVLALVYVLEKPRAREGAPA
jgi:signal peptidase II